MRRTEIQVPAGGIRRWLTLRHVDSGVRVSAGTPICHFEVSTGVFSDGPEADLDLESPASGVIEWAEVAEGSTVEQGQVIGWLNED